MERGGVFAAKNKARKFTPSPETPLIVIIIDELAYLSAATDKKLQQRAQTAMRSILWLGRAAGYGLVGEQPIVSSWSNS